MRGTSGKLRLLAALLLIAAAVTVPIVLASASSAPSSAKAPSGSQLARAVAPGAPVSPAKAVASEDGPTPVGNGIFAGQSYHNDLSPPLSELAKIAPPVLPSGRLQIEPGRIGHAHKNGLDPVVQNTPAEPNMPTPILNFDGIPFPGVACNCAPPDTDGEVGATQYVQMVNEGVQVFNKTTGASVLGPVSISSFWAGFTGACEFQGFGDPVVVYDQIANRWLISQFAGSPVPTTECVAVSTTSDATGTYNRYGFNLAPGQFLDYPKIGVWPDGYYLSANIFNSSGTAFLGPAAWALDRSAMLAGNPATFVGPGIFGAAAAEETVLPADLDGSTLPPANAPNSYVEWPGGTSGNNYKVWHFHADFATPANTTFLLFATVPSAAFTQLCPTTRNCVPQSGTTAKLDAIADRLMFRLAYRNFGDHEAVVGNYTVSSNAVAGIRWFELRNVTNGPVTKFQESTYQPDTTWRWMGSAAMDGQGNLALGFSASSATIVPGIRWAGRLVGDAINTLGQGEATMFAGQGSQGAGTSNRWGDYSDMTIDPVDDCTFWYTQEYYPPGVTNFNWRTRIGNFKFAGCGGGGGNGTLQGTVTNAVGGAPLDGVKVVIPNVANATTDAAGFYTMSVPPGTYRVGFRKTGFQTKGVNNVVVTSGQTTTLNTTMNPN